MLLLLLLLLLLILMLMLMLLLTLMLLLCRFVQFAALVAEIAPTYSAVIDANTKLEEDKLNKVNITNKQNTHISPYLLLCLY